MRRLLARTLAVAVLAVGHAATASAAPVLQLDIAGGVYDWDTKTIIATSNPFTIYAIGTPQGNITTSAMLNDTYYLSAAVSPTVSEPGADLGYFTINGERVNVTGDMIYGKPPVEQMEELQGFDHGDLQGHGIYPTYFAEFAFQFSPDARINEYNSAERALTGGTIQTASNQGNSFVHEWVIDTSTLNPSFIVHFDLYNSRYRRCGSQERELAQNDPACVDVDVAQFAPFAYDAESPPVPEPTTLVLIGTGLAAGAIRRYRNRRAG